MAKGYPSTAPPNKAHKELLSHSNPKVVAAVFRSIPSRSPGPFCFLPGRAGFPGKLSCLSPHPHSSRGQPGRTAQGPAGWGWHKGLHGFFRNTCSRGKTAEMFIVNMLLQTSSLITEQLPECCSADFATPETYRRHFGNLSKPPPKFWPSSSTLNLHPNHKCSQGQLKLP